MYRFDEKDRLLKYFEPYLKSFLFLELKNEFWDKANLGKEAKGVSVPVLPQNLRDFEEDSLNFNHFVENMIFVVGASPNFKFSKQYETILKHLLGEAASRYMMSQGMNFAREKDFKKAIIYFRACYIITENKKESLLNYAKACKEVYTSADEADEIGSFKAESMAAMEELTIDYPDFDQPYYFLGYLYLNMGLYIKAYLSWKKYITKTDNKDGLIEISARLKEIEEPKKIEEAVNKVISGRYEEGYVDLLGYLNSDYNTWWPLHFYLAVASEELGNFEMAEERYKNTLALQPSFVDGIDGLIRVYRALGDEEQVQKYQRKKEIVIENLEASDN